MLDPRSLTMPADVQGLRILGFCDWYSPEASGGGERAAWEIYRRLGAEGARVRVISAAHGRPHRDPNVDVDVVRGFDLSRLAGGYFAPAPGVFPAARRARQAFDPDVIHVNTIHYTGCIAGARLAAKTGIPLVVTVQLGPLDDLQTLTRRLATGYERAVGGYILRRATRVLAVSESAQAHAISLGARPDVVTVAPNGVDHERFRMPPVQASSNPQIIAVGRLMPNKGPDLLVEALGQLDRSTPFRMAFLGDGPMRAQLEQRVAELGLGDRIRFAGQVRQVEQHFAEAEIVVRASYTEGLALAVIEGMATGRCNVVSDIAPNLELIADGVNGRTFRSGDASDLARVLRSVLEDPDERERLGRQAQLDAQPFTWDNMAALHGEAMLESVRSTRTGRPAAL